MIQRDRGKRFVQTLFEPELRDSNRANDREDVLVVAALESSVSLDAWSSDWEYIRSTYNFVARHDISHPLALVLRQKLFDPDGRDLVAQEVVKRLVRQGLVHDLFPMFPISAIRCLPEEGRSMICATGLTCYRYMYLSTSRRHRRVTSVASLVGEQP